MSKVICASAECKYNADDNSCTCDEVYLNDLSIMTVWEGRQHLWRCKSFEENEHFKEVYRIFEGTQTPDEEPKVMREIQ